MYNTDDKQFVITWQGATKVSEVATKMGLSYFAATARAARLRKLKIPLKKMTRVGPRRRVDVKTLTKIARESLTPTTK